MIESGIKNEEYREIKPYWLKRLFYTIDIGFNHYVNVDSECADFYCANIANIGLLKSDFEGGGFKVKGYTHIRFRYGYTKRTMLFELDNITIGRGKTEWGAPKDRYVFKLKLGYRIQ